ncbi:MAG: ribonuclease [Oscillospiraceae bacterium]|nr:ribonuclease [Oscillospiraceae bacterium]
MKNKRFIYILLAIILLAGFLYLRNSSSEAGGAINSLASDTLTVISDSTEAVEVSPDEAQESDLDSTETVQDGEDISLAPAGDDGTAPVEETIAEDGVYDSKEDVALYIHIYGKLPSNFITKKEAIQAGWSGNGGDKLDKYCPGKCIGGDYFGNYENKLPKAPGRKWAECDIDTLGAKNRGIKRIVFSTDGFIYYTKDHYDTFELLYEEP